MSTYPLVSKAFYRYLYGGVDDDRAEDPGSKRNVRMD
jgi:hypothetical protein